jgi:hypothetical protein
VGEEFLPIWSRSTCSAGTPPITLKEDLAIDYTLPEDLNEVKVRRSTRT